MLDLFFAASFLILGAWHAYRYLADDDTNDFIIALLFFGMANSRITDLHVAEILEAVTVEIPIEEASGV